MLRTLSRVHVVPVETWPFHACPRAPATQASSKILAPAKTKGRRIWIQPTCGLSGLHPRCAVTQRSCQQHREDRLGPWQPRHCYDHAPCYERCNSHLRHGPMKSLSTTEQKQTMLSRCFAAAPAHLRHCSMVHQAPRTSCLGKSQCKVSIVASVPWVLPQTMSRHLRASFPRLLFCRGAVDGAVDAVSGRGKFWRHVNCSRNSMGQAPL